MRRRRGRGSPKTYGLAHAPELRLQNSRAFGLQIEALFDDKPILDPPLDVNHDSVRIDDAVQHWEAVEHHLFAGQQLDFHFVGPQMHFSQLDRDWKKGQEAR